LEVGGKEGEENLLVLCSFRTRLGLCRYLRFLSIQISVSLKPGRFLPVLLGKDATAKFRQLRSQKVEE
jgi:hypothetical protein